MASVLRLIALALASTLLLANAEPEDEGTICVTSARLWAGSAEDVRSIRSVPVPDSYRQVFEAGGCSRFQLVEQSLIGWHLAFGDERTTALALAYLEADYRKGVPGPEAFGPYLAAVWEDARKTIAAASLPPTDDPGRAEVERRLRRTASVRRAVAAVQAYSGYVELAGAYARAAELHGSASLLRKAELYFAPAQAGLSIFFADGAQDEADLGNFVHAPSHHLSEILDLEARIPILRARLSRNPDDLDKASAAMIRRYQPVLETAADNAREHSGEYCEIHGEAESESDRALRLVCDEINGFPRRATDFWRNRASLDLLMAADPVHFEAVPRNRIATGSEFVRRPAPDADARPVRWIHSFETAAWLLHYEGLVDRHEQPSRPGAINHGLFALLLARAEMHARRAEGTSDPDEIGPALDYSAQAARLAAPHDSPTLFRKAAGIWLDQWKRAGEVKQIRHWRLGDRGRFAAYLRANLAALDAIATAEDPASTQ